MNKTPTPIRILIADDHPIFRRGLRVLLEAEPDFQIVGEAADGTEVLEMVPRLRPDVLLLDLAMPHLAGMEALRELAGFAPPATQTMRIVILTVAIEKKQIVEALQLGAHGIVLKDAAAQLLIKALREVILGQYWVGRESVTDMVAYLRRISSPAPVGRPGLPALTARERQILSAVVQGLTNREIAEKLSISEDTVKHHMSRVFDKVGVSHRLELAMYAVNHGLIQNE
ncbi:MAG TPA: response regulator transcription factor [Candidatus Dormibacteraeota bacterium]|nr:response regulator transcription factor [Candidatus Dormibacteraeota bacterium]